MRLVEISRGSSTGGLCRGEGWVSERRLGALCLWEGVEMGVG